MGKKDLKFLVLSGYQCFGGATILIWVIKRILRCAPILRPQDFPVILQRRRRA